MPLILGTNSIKDTGFDVANSLRFDRASGDYLSRTPSGAGNRKTFTFSTWLKGHNADAKGSGYFFQADINGSSNVDAIGVTASGFQVSVNSANSGVLNTSQLFRDYSAWYHFVFAVDTTQSTASNRMKLYVNGSQITNFDTETYPSQNYDFTGYNTTEQHNISWRDSEVDGYMAEVCFIDGQQLTPTSFGEFDDSGIWKPKDVSGLTFGTNGFYLDFENSGSLGADVSGNGNNFTVNNLTSVDKSASTCTNNEATLNPLIYASRDNTFSEGNLKITGGGSDAWDTHYGASTIAVSSGKWFVEAKVTTVQTSQGILGLISTSQNINTSLKDIGVATVEKSGRITGGGSNLQTGLTAFSNGDIAGLSFDATNGTAQFYRNGSAYGSAVSSIASDTYYFATATYDAGGVIEFNFGSPPYSESGGNSDGNGYGNFSMAVPSGYYALNTKNLAEYG